MKTIELSKLENLAIKYSEQKESMYPLMLITEDTSTYHLVKEALLNIKDDRRAYTLLDCTDEGEWCHSLSLRSRDRIIVDWQGLAPLNQIELLIGIYTTSPVQVVYLLRDKDLEHLRWLKNHPEEDNYHYNEELLKNNFDMYTVVSSQDGE